jgi:hypothetical protein
MDIEKVLEDIKKTPISSKLKVLNRLINKIFDLEERDKITFDEGLKRYKEATSEEERDRYHKYYFYNEALNNIKE